MFAQTCFCGRRTSISNLLDTVTKQLLVYSNLVGGRDGEWRIGVSDLGLSGSFCSPALHAHRCEHCILGMEGTTEVTPADGMCSPEVTVWLWAAGPLSLPPWPAPCGRCAGRLGAAGQQAPGLSTPLRACLPPPVSLSKTVPSASRLLGVAVPGPPLLRPPGCSAPSPGQAASSLGRANCPQLSTVTVLTSARGFCHWWGDCGLFTH